MMAAPKQVRHKIDVPFTRAQKEAIVKAARKAALPPASWVRMIVMRETDWNPEEDDEFDKS